MHNDGTLNANAGKYADMDRADVRKQIWADMEVSWGLPLTQESNSVNYQSWQRLD